MSAILYLKACVTQSSSLKTELLNNYLWRVHPANLSLQHPGTPPLQFMLQSHSTYAFCYLFSGQQLPEKADSKTESPTTLSPSKPILKGKPDWDIKFNHSVH